MSADNSLLIETLRELIKLLAGENLAPLIKSKDLDATVEEFGNLVKAYTSSKGNDSLQLRSDDELKEILLEINEYISIFSKHNLIELNKLDFVEHIQPKT